MSEEELLFEIDGAIGRVTFNRPAARNALTFGMYERLADICTGIAEGRLDVRTLIISGAGGRAFAAGTDISSFTHFRTSEDALAYEHRIDTVLDALEQVPVPTIAVLHGATVGGGAAIAACCDLRIAAPNLAFGFPIARTLGNCLSIANLARLVALIGTATTREILLSARLIQAEEASRLTLVNDIADDPLERAEELALAMASHAPLTLAVTKEGLRRLRVQGAAAHDDDLVTRCYTSADFHEGVDAFLAKRKPDFQGR